MLKNSSSILGWIFITTCLLSCSTASPFPAQAEFDPAVLTELARGAGNIPGLEIDSVEIVPDVPLFLQLQAARELNTAKDYVTATDAALMYSDLETAYAKGKSCFTVSIKSQKMTDFSDTDLLAYVEDSDHHLYRLAVSASGNSSSEHYIPSSTYTTSSLEYDPVKGKNVTVFHDNQVGGYMAVKKIYSAVYCTLSKIDFSKPFNVYLSSRNFRPLLGATKLSWYPKGSDPVRSDIVAAIEQDLNQNQDFKIQLSKIGKKEMDYFVTALQVADYKLVLSAITYPVDDMTMADRKSLGALTVIDAKRGSGCNTDFITQVVLKGALLDEKFFQKSGNFLADQCSALNFIRFLQLPGHREGAFIRINNALISKVENVFKSITLPIQPQDQEEIKNLFSIEKDVVTLLNKQCSADQGKTCILYSRGQNDILAIQSALKKEKGKKFRPQARDNLKFLNQVFTPISS